MNIYEIIYRLIDEYEARPLTSNCIQALRRWIINDYFEDYEYDSIRQSNERLINVDGYFIGDGTSIENLELTYGNIPKLKNGIIIVRYFYMNFYEPEIEDHLIIIDSDVRSEEDIIFSDGSDLELTDNSIVLNQYNSNIDKIEQLIVNF